jgi:hypothetical protein
MQRPGEGVAGAGEQLGTVDLIAQWRQPQRVGRTD